MNTEPQIEAVTDEDVMVAVNLPARALEPHTRRILEQDRRRVAERQANHGTTHAEGCVSWGRGHYECAMVEIERLRAEVAAHRKHDVLRCDALMKAEAEVAKLNAACAAKHDALGQLFAFVQSNEAEDTPSLRLFAACVAALSTDAGKNYIDATGAVETGVFWYSGRYVVEIPKSMALSRVLIVPVKQ